jgi:uncharacterized membrane protein HdeD (DUF308 family)
MTEDSKNAISVFGLWILSLVFLGIIVLVFINSSNYVRILLIITAILWEIMERWYKFQHKREYGEIPEATKEIDENEETEVK